MSDKNHGPLCSEIDRERGHEHVRTQKISNTHNKSNGYYATQKKSSERQMLACDAPEEDTRNNP